MGRFAYSLRRRLSSEDGFSLIELLVAILVLAIGIFALAATLDGSRALSNTSERLTAASAVAQRQLEDITGRSFSYSNLGMQNPVAFSATDEARQYVCSANATGEAVTFRWNLTACGGGPPYGDEQVVVGSNGIDEQKDGGWNDARSGARGEVFTFVTWVDEDCASELRTSSCGDRDYKRVTVAVTTTNGEPDRPVVVSTLVPNPDENLPDCTGCINPYTFPGLNY